MDAKLDNYLVEKYPKIFVNRYGDKMTTSMCFGFEHNDGWFWLIDQLCGSIQNYIDNNEYRSKDAQISQVVADQVKEKFGGLRFYHTGGDTYIEGMVSIAENMSYNICEFCGSTEDVGRTSMPWIFTICKECYDTSDQRISSLKWKVNEDKKTEICKELRKIKLDKLKQNEK